jgi:hypothetical protein
MKFLLLAMVKRMEMIIGLEEIHGDHPGVIMDFSK